MDFSLSLSICLKTSAWVLRSGMAAQIYDIRAIPNTLLIDPKGNIVGKGMTHEQIEALLNK